MTRLEGLDSADDIALLSNNRLAEIISAKTSLRISNLTTKVTRVSNRNADNMELDVLKC